MWSLNQDAFWNGGEALVPHVSMFALGVSGLASDAATPVPGDGLIYGGVGVMTALMIDATTSGISALYDYGRFTEEIPNRIAAAYAPGYGAIFVHWPAR